MLPNSTWRAGPAGGQRLLRRGQNRDLRGAATAPELCVAALKLRRHQQEADRDRAGEHGSTPAWCSPPGPGTPLEPRNFSRSFDRRITQARVPRITVHGARKTYGPLLAALDVHPRVAMQILRHSKIAVTMEIYTEIPSAATRDALKKLGRWLDNMNTAVAALCCCTKIKNGRSCVRNRPLSWSPVTESNRRPSPYHGDALPTELTGPIFTCLTWDFMPSGHFPGRVQC